ncbi:MAG: DnaA/Hda family protein [Alphaproteobacteria bacterium]|nr:DnaA/Hda family protein [Alphaproteobacteria bacterium]
MSGARQLPLTFTHDPASGLEDFMPAESNEDALAWLKRWPDWPAPVLVLYGPKGAGKSHLAAIWAAGSRALTLDRQGLGDTLDLDASRCYLVDPAEPVVDEIALLQLYNRLREDGGHLLLTARRPVAKWTIDLPDLRSRLAAAPSIAIGAPDDQLLAALLLKLFDDRQLKVPEPVIRYLLTHMERSFEAAHGLVATLDHLSLTRQRPITVPLARIALDRSMGRDAERADDRQS